MKKSLLLIFGVAAMLLAVSCQKERTSAPVQSVSVRTNVSKIVYSASGDTDALTLDATAGWTAVSRAEWLTAGLSLNLRSMGSVLLAHAKSRRRRPFLSSRPKVRSTAAERSFERVIR